MQERGDRNDRGAKVEREDDDAGGDDGAIHVALRQALFAKIPLAKR
jgi:hypothetical protein